MLTLPDDHHCPWRTEALALRESVAAYKAESLALRGRIAELEKAQAESQGALKALALELEKLKRAIFKPKSEKMPSPDRELRRTGKAPKDPEAAKRKRRQNKDQRKELPGQTVEHKVPEDQRTCGDCGKERKPLGPGKKTTMFERLKAQLLRLEHIQETLRCNCEHGEIVTAPGPSRILEQVTYGPGLIAHLITAKCADSMPLYRLAKQYERAGIKISRSTITDLFQQAGFLLRPLHNRLLEIIAMRPVVQADDTPIRSQGKVRGGGRSQPGQAHNARIWTFLGLGCKDLGPELVAYVFSRTKEGDIPASILGTGKGTLIVDGASNYNASCEAGRERSGCMAHVRRKFHEAKEAAPEAAGYVLEQILELYAIERRAKREDRLELRQRESKPIMAALRTWLEDEQPKHLPKGPLAKAIRYALNQWPTLIRFLEDPEIPIDNNASERALRIIALGRKNFLTVGNEEAGKNLACLYSLTATCQLVGVNPEEYLADILPRISTTPLSKIDDLLPQHWKPPPS